MGETLPAVVGNKGGLEALLTMMKSRIAEVLPQHVRPETVFRAAMLAASRSPALYECTRDSLAKSLMDAAQLGLDPSGMLGQGWLVPYRNRKTGCREAQFIPGYRGLIDLARRGGAVKAIHAWPVFKGEKFNLVAGSDPRLEHEPSLEGGKPEDLVGTYAIAWLADCDVPQFRWVSRREIDATRSRSMASDKGPWVTDYIAMALKTAIRRLCSLLPLSAELAAALALDSAREHDEWEALASGGVAPELIDGPRADALAARIKAQRDGADGQPLSDEENARIARGAISRARADAERDDALSDERLREQFLESDEAEAIIRNAELTIDEARDIALECIQAGNTTFEALLEAFGDAVAAEKGV